MDDLPSGLSSKTTYAALSPSDLRSLGKTASLGYVRRGIPLDDMVVKIAREHPSISPHQVRRIAEFANQETFGALFEDNEKYANDKNVEFDVADPGKILMELDHGCHPVAVSVPPEDYSCDPIKTAHKDVLADVLLCRAFGVEPTTPVMEKTAQARPPEVEQHAGALSRILEHEKTAAIPVGANVALIRATAPTADDEPTRVGSAARTGIPAGVAGGLAGAGTGLWAAGGATQELANLRHQAETAARQALKSSGSHEAAAAARKSIMGSQGALALRRSIMRRGLLGLGIGTLAGAGLGAVYGAGRGHRNRLAATERARALSQDYAMQGQSLEPQKTAMIGAMAPEGQVAPTATGGSSDQDHHDRMLEVQREIELAKKRQELMKVQQQTQQMAVPPGMEQMQQDPAAQGMQQDPAAAQGQMPPEQAAMAQQGAPPAGTAPAGGAPMEQAPQQMPLEAAAPTMVPPGSEMPKMGALLGQAINYAKTGRPNTASVVADLEKAASLDRIKESVASRPDYPDADPFHDLYVAKTKVAGVVDVLSRQRSENTYLYKQAKDALAQHVEHHLWDEGNLGEVAHLMASVGSAPGVKLAMEGIMPTLVRRGLSLPAAQAELAEYELHKKASVRVPNTGHPIAQSYAAMCKLARNQKVLTEALREAEAKLAELQEAIKEAGLVGKALMGGMVAMPGVTQAVPGAQAAAKKIKPAPWRVG